MDLLPTPEQEEIVGSVRAVLADRHTLGDALDDKLWDAAVEQGWFALGLDEALGGVGYTLVEEALVFTEIGRAAAPGPFLATVLAVRIAAEGGAPELAAELIAGTTRTALAEHEGDGYRLFDHVDASVAVLLDDDGARVLSLEGLTLSSEDALDTLVPLAVATELGAVLATAPDPDGIRDRALVLLAALLAGVAEATTEQSVAYAKDREQFGQPIGSFQAVKHRCADMAVRADLASSQVRWAALTVSNGQVDATFQATSAAIVAIEAALENSTTNIQNHGGIGFTWEHTAHRYVTRARLWSSLWGGTRAHQTMLLAAAVPT
jgi:alkylation response protein AidB-like acyl-CoA dehydrogenase